MKRSSPARNQAPTHFREHNEPAGVWTARSGWRRLTPFLGAFLLLLSSGKSVVLQSSAQMALDSVESLRSLGQFTVTARGETLESFPSKQKCLYFEWTAGYKLDGVWTERLVTSRSDNALTLVTPRGLLEAPFASLRLYLPVTTAHHLTRQDESSAPALLREQLNRDRRPIELDEILLEEERTYYAMVEPGSTLAISDIPFTDGRSQRPLTPAYQRLTGRE